VYQIKHQGKIREKLSSKGYYISNLGLIKENESSNYALADIRYISGLKKILKGKEEIILSHQNGSGDLRLSRLIRILRKEKIPFRRTKVKKLKINFQVQQLTNPD
jgi:hypothetical protein